MYGFKCVSIINKIKDGKQIYYTVERKYDNKKNISSTSYFNVDGQLHRDGNKPAFIEYDYLNGDGELYVATQVWYQKGKCHRGGDLPAYVEFINGKLYKEWWYQNGKLHRDGDLPASILYINGVKKEENWYYEDKKHRSSEGEDKPARIIYEGNNIVSQYWYQNDKLHRITEDNKPAIINNDVNGDIIDQSWYREGNLYSLPSSDNSEDNNEGYKPAFIGYNSDSKCTKYGWVKPGIGRVTKLKFDNESDQQKYEIDSKISECFTKINSSSLDNKMKMLKLIDIIDQ